MSWWKYGPLKHWFTHLHGATSQKTVFFIVTTVTDLKSYKEVLTYRVTVPSNHSHFSLHSASTRNVTIYNGL
jgi:hypothetical protein